MEEKQTIMALGAGATTKFVFPCEPEDTVCQPGKEHDFGQALIQKSKFAVKNRDMRMERVENVKDVKNYLERVDEMIERKIKKRNAIWSECKYPVF